MTAYASLIMIIVFLATPFRGLAIREGWQPDISWGSRVFSSPVREIFADPTTRLYVVDTSGQIIFLDDTAYWDKNQFVLTNLKVKSGSSILPDIVKFYNKINKYNLSLLRESNDAQRNGRKVQIKRSFVYQIDIAELGQHDLDFFNCYIHQITQGDSSNRTESDSGTLQFLECGIGNFWIISDTVSYSLKFNKCNMYHANLSNSLFRGEIGIIGITESLSDNQRTVSIVDCTFEERVTFLNVDGGSFYNFNNCNFNKQFSIKNEWFYRGPNWPLSYVRLGTDEDQDNACKDAAFYNCKFSDEFYAKGASLVNMEFVRCTYLKSMNLSGTDVSFYSYNEQGVEYEVDFENRDEGLFESCLFPKDDCILYFDEKNFNLSKFRFNPLALRKSVIRFDGSIDSAITYLDDIDVFFEKLYYAISNNTKINVKTKEDLIERFSYQKEILLMDFYGKRFKNLHANEPIQKTAALLQFSKRFCLNILVNLGYQGASNFFLSALLIILCFSAVFFIWFRASIDRYIILSNDFSFEMTDGLVRHSSEFNMVSAFKSIWVSLRVFIDPRLPARIFYLEKAFMFFVTLEWIIGIFFIVIFLVYIVDKYSFLKGLLGF